MFYPCRMSHTANGNGNGTTLAPPPKLPSPTESKDGVSFTNAAGITIQGELARLTRHAATFEIYEPQTVLSTSEVLSEFSINFHGRVIYLGRAVISALLDAGTKTVCDVTLDEANWAGFDFSKPPADGQMTQAFKEFLGEWQKLYQVTPAFKIVIADMQTFLTDLRVWLDQVELGIRAVNASRRHALEQNIARELAPAILPLVTSFFEKFENILHDLEPERLPAHQIFARRQLHPLLLCSPFLHRCFTKPLGYAGDYEMVNMMLREELQGTSLYAKIINLWFVQQPPAEAHRNRIQRLARQLQDTTARLARAGRKAKILNIGCGPAHEVQQFLCENHLANHAHFTLIDFNEETLAHCQSVVNEAKAKGGRNTQFKFVKKSVQQIVRESARRDQSGEQFDLVYCAGLFDYLGDGICQRLTDIFYDWTAPGGRVMTTNVDAYNPRKITMDHIMEWHLIYRRSADMLALKPGAAPDDCCGVQSDSTGVNIYFEAQKPT
jgi:extracellular factor (EF) 3-hydroxypalmitic acid methyl ester biosynthesis protein